MSRRIWWASLLLGLSGCLIQNLSPETRLRDAVIELNEGARWGHASGIYHYPQLKAPLEGINSPITLLYGHDNPDGELDDWTNSSDHRIFHQKNIPFIYFGVEDHKDYHKPSDTFQNINRDFYINAVKLIIQAIENYDQAL